MIESVEFSTNVKLLQIYSGKYCTVIDTDYLYLLENVQINTKNIIAKIDVKENVEIIDRDKVNVFIDWSNMHFGNKDAIDTLAESKIKDYLIDFLWPDINELVDFKNDDYSMLLDLTNHFSQSDKENIFKALEDLGLTEKSGLKFTEVYSKYQIDYLVNKKYYYICLNLSKLKYAVSSSDFKKYYSNGACGNWHKLIKNPEFKVLFFNKNDEFLTLSKTVEAILKNDISKQPELVINSFLKLEDKFIKALNEMVDNITAKQGILSTSQIYYPNVEDKLIVLEVLLRNYQIENEASNKLNIFKQLSELYSAIYSEFSKSQNCLRELCTYKNEGDN